MAKKLFDYVIGNPPYQEESSDSVSKSNGQKPMTNIFQYFQEAADEITETTSVLIYPGGRWIHQSGKGLQKFGKKQINDRRLAVVEFYPDAEELKIIQKHRMDLHISIQKKEKNLVFTQTTQKMN